MSDEKTPEQDSLEAGKQETEQKKHGHKHPAEHEVEKLKKELDEALRKRTEYEEAFVRKTAEFENYKKKVAADSEKNRVMAAKDMVMQMIPVADNFERAMKAAESTRNFDALLAGIKMTYAEIQKIFTAAGVSPIDSLGKEFDPYLHEAMLIEDRHDVEFPQTVVEEFEKGYRLGESVIRHSKVKVGRKTEKNAEMKEENQQG